MDIYHIIKRDYPQLTDADFERTRTIGLEWVDGEPVNTYTEETAKCVISDDGSGQFISHWDDVTLGPMPTITQADIDILPTAQEAADILDRKLNVEFQKANKASSFDKAIAATLFELVNIVRVEVQSKAPLTAAAFKNYIKGKM